MHIRLMCLLGARWEPFGGLWGPNGLPGGPGPLRRSPAPFLPIPARYVDSYTILIMLTMHIMSPSSLWHHDHHAYHIRPTTHRILLPPPSPAKFHEQAGVGLRPLHHPKSRLPAGSLRGLGPMPWGPWALPAASTAPGVASEGLPAGP